VAKLYLKYEQTLLKELPITQPVVTVGRLPDNTVQLDNPAVSSYHAKIYWDRDHYVVEDNNSLNGTYVNSARVTRSNLKDGDIILIGKHTLVFASTGLEYIPGREGAPSVQAAAPVLPRVEQTQFLDTRKMKDMLADKGKQPATSGAQVSEVPTQEHLVPPAPGAGIGALNVLEGKTDQNQYLLTSKMNVIGKSAMASIKLKGWFAPQMAALISKSDKGYFIAASEKKVKVKVNGENIAGQKSLSNGDTIEVAGVKMTFALK
jgi:pSer/pThr/pTyr-binding forkhead associated (FHA) protein